jgi:hypothetical protein
MSPHNLSQKKNLKVGMIDNYISEESKISFVSGTLATVTLQIFDLSAF